MKTTNFLSATLNEFANHAISQLRDGVAGDCYGCDLHSKLFNEEYYIIGYYQCEQWLIGNTGVFNGIAIVQEYEKSNFGEVNTDLSSSEAIVNMLSFIGGEEVLAESSTLQENWDNRLDEQTIEAIIAELEAKFN